MKLDTLLVVKNVDISRHFYQQVLLRRIMMDLGMYVAFVGGLTIFAEMQWRKLLDKPDIEYNYHNHVGQLKFEKNNFDDFLQHLKKFNELEMFTPLGEYSWGQRFVRFYDPDGHLIEVSESMKNVVKRLLINGVTIEETVDKSRCSIGFVEQCKYELANR